MSIVVRLATMDDNSGVITLQYRYFMNKLSQQQRNNGFYPQTSIVKLGATILQQFAPQGDAYPSLAFESAPEIDHFPKKRQNHCFESVGSGGGWGQKALTENAKMA